MANALGYDLLQNGVVASGDLAQTLGASSITNGGTVTYSIAAATAAWVKDANSALIRITPAAQNSQTFVASITSTKYVVYGIEIDPNGVLSAVKGAETATQLNTGSLIASNTPATTSGKMRIMDIAIWNNAGTYNYGDHTQSGSQGVNWIDRRPWARGAFYEFLQTSNIGGITSSSLNYLDISNLNPRIECTGVPVELIVNGAVGSNTSGAQVGTGWGQDGVGIYSAANNYAVRVMDSTVPFLMSAVMTTTPSAGSHRFGPLLSTNAGTAQANGSASAPFFYTIREVPRANTNNGTA